MLENIWKNKEYYDDNNDCGDKEKIKNNQIELKIIKNVGDNGILFLKTCISKWQFW